MKSLLFWDVGRHQLGVSCRRFGNIVSVPSSSVTLEDGTDTILQAVGYKLPHNTVQCPKRARNSYTALRILVFFPYLASTEFHRWATTVLRVYRIHFVGAIWVSTQSLNLLNEKDLTDSRSCHLCEIWSPELRRGYANFIMCLYIYTLLQLYVRAQAFYERHYLSSLHLLQKSRIL